MIVPTLPAEGTEEAEAPAAAQNATDVAKLDTLRVPAPMPPPVAPREDMVVPLVAVAAEDMAEASKRPGTSFAWTTNLYILFYRQLHMRRRWASVA